MTWDIVLGAVLEVSLGLLAEAGFADETRALKERLTKRSAKARRRGFERAFRRAVDAVGEESLGDLLDQGAFQEAVITGLLDPAAGFDLPALAEAWGERTPARARALRRFFSILENALLEDETWGPLLERYQALRFRREVAQALRERRLDASPGRLVSLVSADLRGRGAVAQGAGAVAAGADGLAVGGDVGQIVQVIVQQLTVTGGAAPAAGDRPEDLRQRYLAELAQEANRLPWAVVEQEYADPGQGKPIGLAEVYTALDTTELEHVEREEELRRFLARLEHGEARRVPAQELVNRERRLVILGDPGSGKSTFVNHLAYTLAQANLAQDSDPWLARVAPWDHGPLLPVRVELRALAMDVGRDQCGDARLLLGHLRGALETWQLAEFWPLLERAIRDKKESLLFLLDGLDEVPRAARHAVVGAVQDFADRYGQHRYVVTCRPYAYVGQPCQLRRFREVTLAPFDKDQVAHFIAAWYGELARQGRISAGESEERAGRLQWAVQQQDLWGLAQRPLLLTVMTLLHTFRGKLPEDRTELYADAVDLLLRRWESRVGGEAGVLARLGDPELKMSDLEAGLYEVAFRAHRGQGEAEGTADVDEAELRKWLSPYLGNDWMKAGEFVAYIRERAGLLVRHKTEAYTFPHRTFQEFLAACHLVGMANYPGDAAGLVREEAVRWSEVFVLAAGHAARTHRLSQAIAAVNELCSGDVGRGGKPGGAEFRRAVLAGEALLEIGLVGVRRGETGRAVLERVQGWLGAGMRADEVLEPRERAEAGNVLAKLGDPRFRPDAWYLPDEPLLGFVEVPEGPFVMGTREEEIPELVERFGGKREWYEDEVPQHEVILPACYVARYPVTVAQFRAFAEAGGYREPHYWREAEAAGNWRDGQVRRVTYRFKDEKSEELEEIEEWGGDVPDYGGSFNSPTSPVVGVTWYEALSYCRWLAERLRDWDGTPEPLATRLREENWTIALLSEAEWVKAARGTGPRQFPWGEEPDPNRANYDETGIGATSAVGCFPGGASRYGVEDLSGNVWEWTRSVYKGYPYDSEDGRETLDAGDEAFRVLRGGAFYYVARLVRCAYRYWLNPYLRYYFVGFRLVASPVHL